MRLGILTDSQAQAYALQSVATLCGLQVGYNGRIARGSFQRGNKPDVDAWIVAGGVDGMARLGRHPFIDVQQQVLVLEETVPTLASAGFEQWQAMVRQRLQSLADRHRQLGDFQPAEIVWVLAASTGGLEAVGHFLSLVPPLAGVGLVYVQHIDAAHVGQLLRMVGRLSQWSVELARHGMRIRERTVTVVSPAAKIEIANGGSLGILPYPWAGKYSPSIDHVAGQVARAYAGSAGMIVFTGMGYDGVVGSRLIRHRGGQVWVQNPKDCTAPSMPEAVTAVQAVDYMGTVEQLAAHFRDLHHDAVPAMAAQG